VQAKGKPKHGENEAFTQMLKVLGSQKETFSS
jgi:hypothetical protein